MAEEETTTTTSAGQMMVVADKERTVGKNIDHLIMKGDITPTAFVSLKRYPGTLFFIEIYIYISAEQILEKNGYDHIICRADEGGRGRREDGGKKHRIFDYLKT